MIGFVGGSDLFSGIGAIFLIIGVIFFTGSIFFIGEVWSNWIWLFDKSKLVGIVGAVFWGAWIVGWVVVWSGSMGLGAGYWLAVWGGGNVVVGGWLGKGNRPGWVFLAGSWTAFVNSALPVRGLGLKFSPEAGLGWAGGFLGSNVTCFGGVFSVIGSVTTNFGCF